MARNRWTRSCNPSNGNNVRNVNATTGALNNNNARNGNCVAPDCENKPVSSRRKPKAVHLA